MCIRDSISAESERFCQEGLAAYGRFEYDAAIAAYDKAIQADGRNYQALSGKGVALAMRGNETGSHQDVADGIASIQKALALQPDYVPAFYDLALAYKIDGQYDKSISYFQKVLAADPNNTWSYYGIATIYGDKGDAKNAVVYLKKAAALDKENVLEAARTQSHFDSIPVSYTHLIGKGRRLGDARKRNGQPSGRRRRHRVHPKSFGAAARLRPGLLRPGPGL